MISQKYLYKSAYWARKMDQQVKAFLCKPGDWSSAAEPILRAGFDGGHL